MQVPGSCAVITGGSSGIGAETARQLAERGAQIVLIARNTVRLEAVASRIRQAGGSAQTYAADLSRPGEVARVCGQVMKRHGVPDILVNNAGAGRMTSCLETSATEAQRMMDVPYFAAFNMTRGFLPGMVERGRGRIVNLTSVGAYMAWPQACGYIAARHAIKGFSDGLAAELRGTGVGVSLVVLGTVESPYWQHNPGSREKLPATLPRLMPVLSPEQAGAAIVEAIEKDRARVVRPPAFRWIFGLEALFPGFAGRWRGRAPGKEQPHAPVES